MEKPFFSTRGQYPFVFIIIEIVFFVIFAVIFVIKHTGDTILFLGLSVLLGLIILKNIGVQKSYVAMYEDRIEGLSLPKNIFGGLNEMHYFELNYNEIINVSSKNGTVVITYNGGSYEVQAYKCEQKVIKLIKSQKFELSQSKSSYIL